MKTTQWSLLLCLSFLLSGCSMMPYAHIRGGSFTHTSSSGAQTSFTQSQDPKSDSKVDTDSEKTTEFVVPAGSVVSIDIPDAGSKTNKTTAKVVISKDMPVRTIIRDSVKSSVGGAQKNVIGETIAKLSSLRWVTWLGAGMFLFGLVSLFYPPLKAIIMSTTTSMAIAAGGVLLIILPVVIVGHEILILSFIGGAIAIWFLGHRYATHATKATVYKDIVDKLHGVIATTETTSTTTPSENS